jgi:hypothetical protein
MIEFFLTTLRLVRGVASAWKRDPEFRSLVFLVLVTLLGGTIFYSLEEGWSVVDSFYFSVTTLTTVGLGDLRACFVRFILPLHARCQPLNLLLMQLRGRQSQLQLQVRHALGGPR